LSLSRKSMERVIRSPLFVINDRQNRFMDHE